MNHLFWPLLLGVCLNVCSVRAQGGDLSKLSEADRKQVNEWMAQRAEAIVEAHRVDSEVKQAWMDTKYSTPEVDALRARYRELQRTLIKTQEQIQKKVLDVPAVQAKVRALEEIRAKERDLSKKISEKTGE